MSYYNRDQEQIPKNADQEWNRQLLERRGEDVYGEGDDYSGEGYRNPRKPPFPVPYAKERSAGFRYSNQTGYGQEDYNSLRWGLPDNYGHLGDRRWDDDDGRGGWWENERSERPGYRSMEERKNQQIGMHSGKGPRGYQRSDERILEDVNDRLSDDSFIDASDIEVAVNQGEVTLTGIVEDKKTKRRTEDVCESVPGVKNVENRLRLKKQNVNDVNESEYGHSERIVGPQRSKVREIVM